MHEACLRERQLDSAAPAPPYQPIRERPQIMASHELWPLAAYPTVVTTPPGFTMPGRTASFLLAGLSLQSATSSPLNPMLNERHCDSRNRTRKGMRVKFARYVPKRVERYSAFCGAHKLAELVECARASNG